MGIYLNPGNAGFQSILKNKYIDKTGMIGMINRTIGTDQKLTYITRPRRFGKSYAAKMLCAYYDKSCDSKLLFHNLAAEKDETFSAYLNQQNVIYLDITGFISSVKSEQKNINSIVNEIRNRILKDIHQAGQSQSN